MSANNSDVNDAVINEVNQQMVMDNGNQETQNLSGLLILGTNAAPIQMAVISPEIVATTNEMLPGEDLKHCRLKDHKPCGSYSKSSSGSSQNGNLDRILNSISEKFMNDSCGPINEVKFKCSGSSELNETVFNNSSIETSIFYDSNMPAPVNIKNGSSDVLNNIEVAAFHKVINKVNMSSNNDFLHSGKVIECTTENSANCTEIQHNEQKSAVVQEQKSAVAHFYSNKQTKIEGIITTPTKKETTLPEIISSMKENSQIPVQISVKKPIDIMMHKDKINILRQMSQIFNEEQPNVSEDASSASEDEAVDLHRMQKTNLIESSTESLCTTLVRTDSPGGCQSKHASQKKKCVNLKNKSISPVNKSITSVRKPIISIPIHLVSKCASNTSKSVISESKLSIVSSISGPYINEPTSPNSKRINLECKPANFTNKCTNFETVLGSPDAREVSHDSDVKHIKVKYNGSVNVDNAPAHKSIVPLGAASALTNRSLHFTKFPNPASRQIAAEIKSTDSVNKLIHLIGEPYDIANKSISVNTILSSSSRVEERTDSNCTVCPSMLTAAVHKKPLVINTLQLKLKTISSNGTEKISCCTLQAKDHSLPIDNTISSVRFSQSKHSNTGTSIVPSSCDDQSTIERYSSSQGNTVQLSNKSLSKTIEKVILTGQNRKFSSQLSTGLHHVRSCSSPIHAETSSSIAVISSNEIDNGKLLQHTTVDSSSECDASNLPLPVMKKNKENEKIYHVPYERRQESERISVESFVGDSGECVDIIDGFSFVSYETGNDLVGHLSLPTRPRRILKNKIKRRKIRRWTNRPIKKTIATDVFREKKLDYFPQQELHSDIKQEKKIITVCDKFGTEVDPPKFEQEDKPVDIRENFPSPAANVTETNGSCAFTR